MTGRIPSTKKFVTKQTCSDLHPGVCKTELSAAVVAASSQLVKCVSGWPPGAVLRLEATSTDDVVHFLYRMVSVSDKGYAVFIDCLFYNGSLKLKMNFDSGLACQMAERVALDVWAALRDRVKRVVAVRLRAAPPTSYLEARRPVPKYVLPDAAGSPEALLVWPPPAAPAHAPPDTGVDKMTQTLDLVRNGLRQGPPRREDEDPPESSSSEDEAVITKLAADLEKSKPKKLKELPGVSTFPAATPRRQA